MAYFGRLTIINLTSAHFSAAACQNYAEAYRSDYSYPNGKLQGGTYITFVGVNFVNLLLNSVDLEGLKVGWKHSFIASDS